MLGRGLESLIPNKGNQEARTEKIPAAQAALDKHDAVFHLETEKIAVNPFQPRQTFDADSLKELAASIREYGIIQPLVVSKIERETEQGTAVEYQLIAGERRLQAAKMLGLERVPAIVRSVPQERQKLELALIENVQRENLNPLEAARAYAKLQDTFSLTQREIAARVGKSRETIANMVRLLNLPSHIQEALSKNAISESQARLLLAVSDQAQQETLFRDITRNNVSVRDLKQRVARLRRGSAIAQLASAAETALPDKPVIDPEIVALQDVLEEVLGARVKVLKSSDTEVNITFSSPEDLRTLIQKILPWEKQQGL